MNEKDTEYIAESLGGPGGWDWMCQDCDTKATHKVGECMFCPKCAQVESNTTGLHGIPFKNGS